MATWGCNWGGPSNQEKRGLVRLISNKTIIIIKRSANENTVREHAVNDAPLTMPGVILCS